MILRLFLATVLALQAAAAEHRYILPVVGSATSFDGEHDARVTFFNPTARNAVITLTGVYPLFPVSASCAPRWVFDYIPPHRKATFDASCNNAVYAVELVASEPLHVETTIIQTRLFGCPNHDTQQFEAPTEWFDPGVDVVVETRASAFAGYRSNLVLVNPNDEPLVIALRVLSLDIEEDNIRDETVVVAPRSLLIHSVREVKDLQGIDSPFPVVISGEHLLTLRASGRFWAGASEITAEGSNRFHKGIQLEP